MFSCFLPSATGNSGESLCIVNKMVMQQGLGVGFLHHIEFLYPQKVHQSPGASTVPSAAFLAIRSDSALAELG